jgi:hypothetical protein
MTNSDPNKIKEKMLKVMEESKLMREELASRTIRAESNFIIKVPWELQHWFGIANFITFCLEGSITIIRPDKFEQMVKDFEESQKDIVAKDERQRRQFMFGVVTESPITKDGFLFLPSDWLFFEDIKKSPELIFIDSGAELFILKGHKECKCDNPLCGKCLGVGCIDPFCPFHDIREKISRREYIISTVIGESKPDEKEKLKQELQTLKNYLKIKERVIKNLEEYNEKKYIIILGEKFDSEKMPEISERMRENPSSTEKWIRSVADAWHEGDVVSAVRALESDLQHG